MIHLPHFPALSLLVSGFLGLMAGTRIDAAPLKLVEQTPVSVKRIDDKVILVDFGRVAFGNLELKLPSEAKTPISQ